MSREKPEEFPIRPMEEQTLPLHNICIIQDRLAKDIDSLKGVEKFLYRMSQDIDERLGELEKKVERIQTRRSGKIGPGSISSLPSELPGEVPQKKIEVDMLVPNPLPKTKEVKAVIAIPIPKEAVKMKKKLGRPKKQKKWGKPGRHKKSVRQIAEEQLKIVYNPDTDPIKNGVDDE